MKHLYQRAKEPQLLALAVRNCVVERGVLALGDALCSGTLQERGGAGLRLLGTGRVLSDKARQALPNELFVLLVPHTLAKILIDVLLQQVQVVVLVGEIMTVDLVEVLECDQSVSLLQVELRQVLPLQILGYPRWALQQTVIVGLAPNRRNFVVAEALRLRVAEEGELVGHEFGVEVELTSEDVLQYLAHLGAHILDLLAEHHAFLRE